MKRTRFLDRALKPMSEWPMRTCSEDGCGHQWKHPTGGEAVCDGCRERKESEAAAEAERFQAEQAARAKAERERSLRADLREHMAAAGVPGGYLRYTRASWEAKYGPWSDRDSTAELIGWPWEPMPETDWLILFYGPYGARKTSMATAILSEAVLRDLPCCWMDMNHYVDLLKLGIRRERAEENVSRGKWDSIPHDLHGVQTYGAVKRWATDCAVLVIDDLGSIRGARQGEAWWREEVTYLLRQRHAWNRATICTTNGRIQDLATIDPSLVSRMEVRLAFEMDDGQDHRRREALEEPTRPRRVANAGQDQRR